ncbi:hypothetical protein D3C73_1553500 [compost metagenome]
MYVLGLLRVTSTEDHGDRLLGFSTRDHGGLAVVLERTTVLVELRLQHFGEQRRARVQRHADTTKLEEQVIVLRTTAGVTNGGVRGDRQDR